VQPNLQSDYDMEGDVTTGPRRGMTFIRCCPQVPELQCGELSGTVLQLKALGVDNVMAFDYLAPPPAEAMVKAAELLHALGAIDDKSRLWL